MLCFGKGGCCVVKIFQRKKQKKKFFVIDGALAVTISQDFYHRILAACAEEEEDWIDHDFTEEVNDELDGDNSDQERAHESARLASVGELPRNRIVRTISAKMLD